MINKSRNGLKRLELKETPISLTLGSQSEVCRMAKKSNKTINISKMTGWQKKKASRKKRSSYYSERKQFLKRLKE